MNATLRAASLLDADQLLALVRAFPTPTPTGAEAFRHALSAKLGDPASCVVVADRAGHLTGYVSGYCHPAFYAAGLVAWVDELFVVPEERGAGVGRGLMAAFEDWAARHQCVLIGLATRGAAPFYEHLGYESRAGYFKKYLAGPD